MKKLKKFSSKIILGLIKKISVVYIKLENKEKLIKELEKESDLTLLRQNKYLSLAPDEDIDISGYEEALESALNNPSVKNIAVSGSYGSGKSSFLRTFENKHDDNKWKYLKISLANFDKEKVSNEIIEKSILQQIFSHVKDKEIPHSRFKRIKNHKKLMTGLKTIILILFATLGVFIFKPKKLTSLDILKPLKILEITNFIESKWYYSGSILLIFALICGCCIYKILNLLLKVNIKKLNAKNGEIEISEKEESSILNKNLDEILYFFEVTKFNVVVFEDLDRFENSKIFIKLREINTLINNYDTTNKEKVVFIYAIKDDMFSDKERVKFFDLMIPIIPYINSSNSYEKIKKYIINENELNNSFLREISWYINDMRLLKNISNEFKIYSEKLEEGIDKNKLLAMVVYKNIYPEDFSKLHSNEGMIYDAFNKKEEAIIEIIKGINEKIEKLKNKIKLASNEMLENIQELRAVYISAIYEKNSSITGLKVNGARVEFKNLKEDDFFYSLKENNKINYYIFGSKDYYNKITYREAGEITTFKEIEKSISDLSYDEREKAIKNKQENQQEEIKQEIEKQEKEKEKIKMMKIEQLIEEYDSIKFFKENIEDKVLLSDLIEGGYIDENYCDYISIFHDEIIKREDNNFILSVKNNDGLGYNYSEISEFEEVIIRLSDRDFNKKSILNFKLFDYILEHKFIYDKQYKKIFNQLKNESEESISFIFEYIEFDKYRKEFIKELASKWGNLWIYIEEKSNFTTERIEKYLTWILEYSEIKDIERLNINSSLKNYIEKQEKLLSLSGEKYQQIIEVLDIKFKYINDFTENQKMFDYIYENSCYQFNEKMINQIIFDKGYGRLEKELKTAHLTTITEREGLEKLNNYIEKNIDEYVEKVFLKIEKNVEESLETIIWLLNNDDISDENKVEIIRKENQKIDDIEKINNSELWIEIVKSNRINPTWSNLLAFYNNDEFDKDVLFGYLNREENYKKLSGEQLKGQEGYERSNLKGLEKIILESNEISNETYAFLTQSFSGSWETLEINKLSTPKIESLLLNNLLAIHEKIINDLKIKFPNKHIELLENHIDNYLENFDDIELESEDYIELLKSKKIEVNHKLEIFEKMDRVLIEDFVDEFIEIVIENRASDDNLFGLLNIEDLSNENKIKIIEDVDEIINNIKNIKDYTLWSEIIKNNKVSPCWQNVLLFYGCKKLEKDIIVEYLNRRENYEALSEMKLEFQGEDGYDLEIIILESNKLSNNAYATIVKNFEGHWDSLDIINLSEFKIKILISNNLLAVNKRNINDLKETFPDKHINFIENHIEEYLEEFEEINLEGEDYTKLLKSEKLKVSKKIEIIKKLDMEGLDENTELISEISKIYIENPEKIDDEVSKKLLELLITQIQYLNKIEISGCLKQLKEPYNTLIIGEKPKGKTRIEETYLAQKLVEELKVKKYIVDYSIESEKIIVSKRRK